MRKLVSFIIAIFIISNVSAQIQCADLSAYDNAYLNAVTSDNITYPIGSAFMVSGDIQYVKPGPNNFYQGLQGDSLFYIGDVDLDVSTLNCNNKVLTFSCVYLEGLAVDGDTIFSFLSPPAFYSGAGFTFQYSAPGNYTITGDFDVTSLSSSTNFLFDVCLECLDASSTVCVSLAPYTETYLSNVSTDDVTYPVGTAFITAGDIHYVKPSSGNFYQFIMGDTLMYIGDIDIDVSSSTCTNKSLVFTSAYTIGIAIDGDTIFNSMISPASYTGTGFEFTYFGNGQYQITGDFDVVSIFSSTNFLFDVCLECLDANSTVCVSLASYTESYLLDVSTDDVTYPVGTAFITAGDIHYVKPSSGNFYQFIMGDTLMYIGDIDIDVSSSICTNNSLVFTSAYTIGIAIDGDTIFNSMVSPASYIGAGFEFTYFGNGQYQVTGDFDVVSIFSSTNFLFDVCLECNSSASVENNVSDEISFDIFPNPSNGIFNISSDEIMDIHYQILNTEGVVIVAETIINGNAKIDLTEYPSGLYFLVLRNNLNTQTVKKLIKR